MAKKQDTRSDALIEMHHKVIIEECILKKTPQRQVAEQLGIDQATVSRDVTAIKKRMAMRNDRAVRDYLNTLRLEAEELRQRLWEQALAGEQLDPRLAKEIREAIKDAFEMVGGKQINLDVTSGGNAISLVEVVMDGDGDSDSDE